MTAGPGLMPWRLTAVGVVLVLLTALVGGFLLAYWAGSVPRHGAVPIAPLPPTASAPLSVPQPKAAAAPAPAPPSKVVPAPAPTPPPKVAPAPAAALPPKVASVQGPVVAPQPASQAPVKRSRPESAPAPAVKPRTGPVAPSQADVDACTRYASVQAEEHDKSADDDQDRKSDEAYQKAYASCLQARGFKKTRSDD